MIEQFPDDWSMIDRCLISPCFVPSWPARAEVIKCDISRRYLISLWVFVDHFISPVMKMKNVRAFSLVQSSDVCLTGEGEESGRKIIKNRVSFAYDSTYSYRYIFLLKSM